MEINVKNGTIDLLTGEFTPRNTGEKRVNFDYKEKADCVFFEKFLSEICTDAQKVKEEIGHSFFKDS